MFFDKERRSQVLDCLKVTETNPNQTEELLWSHRNPFSEPECDARKFIA
jgi:hypothetical protein